jgi:hypothetical protein
VRRFIERREREYLRWPPKSMVRHGCAPFELVWPQVFDSDGHKHRPQSHGSRAFQFVGAAIADEHALGGVKAESMRALR